MCGGFSPQDLAEIEQGFSFDKTVLKSSLRRIYKEEFNVTTEIDEGLFDQTLKNFNTATDIGIGLSHFDPRPAFINELKYNNAVFSAFRVHRMQNDIAKQLIDSEGKLKTFRQFAKDVAPITDHHVNQWLRTEYDTAVIRAHQAADWKQFEAEKDVLPNLEWMPTTSLTPGEDHRPFWGTIAPVNAGFWNEHRPGDRWNCKCRLQATDKAVKPFDGDAKNINPQPGLDNNPADDGKLFSDTNPYKTNAYPGAEKAVDNFIENKVDHTQKEFKSGGVIQTPKNFKQNADEVKKNIKAYTALAKEQGEKYRLLSVVNEDGKKNPDALNLITGKFSDAKIPTTNIAKNGIQNAIKAASGQKVSEVYIYLEKDYPQLEIWKGLKAAFQKGRAETIETVIIRLKTGEIKKYDAGKLKRVFNKKSKGKAK